MSDQEPPSYGPPPADRPPVPALRTACRSCAGGTEGNGVRRRSPCLRQAKNLRGLILTRPRARRLRQARRPPRLLSLRTSPAAGSASAARTGAAAVDSWPRPPGRGRGSHGLDRRKAASASVSVRGSWCSSSSSSASALRATARAAARRASRARPRAPPQLRPGAPVRQPGARVPQREARPRQPRRACAARKSAAARASAIHQARLARENTLISAAQWDAVIQGPANYEGDIYTIAGTVTEYNLNSNTLATQESAALVASMATGNDFVVEAPTSVLGMPSPAIPSRPRSRCWVPKKHRTRCTAGQPRCPTSTPRP